MLKKLSSNINHPHLNKNYHSSIIKQSQQLNQIKNYSSSLLKSSSSIILPGRFSSSTLLSINGEKKNQKNHKEINKMKIKEQIKIRQSLLNERLNKIKMSQQFHNNRNKVIKQSKQHKQMKKQFQENKNIKKQINQEEILKQNVKKLKQYYNNFTNVSDDKQNMKNTINLPEKNNDKPNLNEQIIITKLVDQINTLKGSVLLTENQLQEMKSQTKLMEESFKLIIMKILKIFTICEKFTSIQSTVISNREIIKLISKQIMHQFSANQHLGYFIKKFNLKQSLNMYTSKQNQSQVQFIRNKNNEEMKGQSYGQCNTGFIEMFQGRNLLDTFNHNNNNIQQTCDPQKQINKIKDKSIYSQYVIQLQEQSSVSRQANNQYKQNLQNLGSSNICRKLFSEESQKSKYYANQEVNEFLSEFSLTKNQITTPRLSEYCFRQIPMNFNSAQHNNDNVHTEKKHQFKPSNTYSCSMAYPNDVQVRQNYLILNVDDKVRLIRKIKDKLWIGESASQMIGFVEESYLTFQQTIDEEEHNNKQY